MGKLSVLEALLGVGEGDVEKLRVGAHNLLSHLLEGLLLLLSLLLEGLLLLLSLLLEGLLLLLGLLHPLLGRLLEGLLLLLGLPREVGAWGVEKLHVGVDQLLGHLLGVLLLLLDLLCQRAQRVEPLLPGLLRHLPCPVRASFGHIFSLFGDECACLCVPIWAATEP